MPSDKLTSSEQKVLKYIQKHRLFTRGEKVLVAVSGGPDSVCLLHILTALRDELGIELHVAHLDHRLRGKESRADATYVAGLAKKLNIPTTIASKDVRAYRSQHRLTLEEAAREVRYSFLEETAAKTGAAKVAVGHTADDLAETVLMHIIRGSGMRGLRGLLPISQFKIAGKNVTVVRPLLELTREETVAYCREHNLKPRADTSNLSLEPRRNRVRRSLIPALKRYNPQIREALKRLAATAADDLGYLEKDAIRAAKKTLKMENGAAVIGRQSFLKLHPALQRQLLRTSVEAVLGSLKDIEAGHIEDIMSALEKPSGKVIRLPFGVNFTVEHDRYVITSESASLFPFPPLQGEIQLKVPGKTELPGWCVTASVVTKAAKNAGKFNACFDLDSITGLLMVRCRRPGDRFQPLGMWQPKKLNIFMIDALIPKAWRGRVPIVCGGGQIIWVAGYRIDERYKVKPDTKNVLKLEFKRTQTSASSSS